MTILSFKLLLVSDSILDFNLRARMYLSIIDSLLLARRYWYIISCISKENNLSEKLFENPPSLNAKSAYSMSVSWVRLTIVELNVDFVISYADSNRP